MALIGVSNTMSSFSVMRRRQAYLHIYEPRHAIMCLREINNVMRYDVVKSDVVISRRA